ncbi:zinc finger and BTB domain-containing protein 14-like [Limulus polyphemus]|uniref:Zinc finger and BTB domain-containing protein 14-like n=1 Tax=Limulus polyphemus TaxID=6850 RepID=A0ABM1SLI8_LIMPO|nr:zinc finger and BTB domain-containing protein 14-like [Limulus polyphemus]
MFLGFFCQVIVKCDTLKRSTMYITTTSNGRLISNPFRVQFGVFLALTISNFPLVMVNKDSCVYEIRTFERLKSKGKLANQQCVVCNQKLNSRAALKRHMKIHFPSREKFACFLCGTVVSRKDHLNRHMRWQHKDLVFICPICKRLFMSNDELNYHLTNSHKDNFEVVSILSMESSPIKFMKTEEKED